MKADPEPRVIAWVDEQPTATLFISAVTRAEIELGIALLPDGQRKQNIEDAAQRMFAAFSGRLLVFGELAAIQYGQLVAQRTKSGRPITVEDAQIAAIALAHGLRLVTRNVRDFRDIPNLSLTDPWHIQSN
jgi:hypothetical protein